MHEMNVPEGWKLVPSEPTDEMLQAAVKGYAQEFKSHRMGVSWSLYRAMLAAAPQPPRQEPTSLYAAAKQARDWISEEPSRRPISAGRMIAILTLAISEANPTIQHLPPDDTEGGAI